MESGAFRNAAMRAGLVALCIGRGAIGYVSAAADTAGAKRIHIK